MTKSYLDVLQTDAVTAAKSLLGWELYNLVNGQLVGGQIIETEAYTQEDPASHTYRGQTARNAPMFLAAGTIYIYFTYGMHWCMNLVTGNKGHGEAVLLRGLQPLKGIEIMRQNRKVVVDKDLCNGPAKLVQALGIDPAWTGKPLDETTLVLSPGTVPKQILTTARIGITEGREKLWRFTV